MRTGKGQRGREKEIQELVCSFFFQRPLDVSCREGKGTEGCGLCTASRRFIFSFAFFSDLPIPLPCYLPYVSVTPCPHGYLLVHACIYIPRLHSCKRASVSECALQWFVGQPVKGEMIGGGEKADGESRSRLNCSFLAFGSV
mmetsp:Transcript_31794/g.62973  ORF Transcript_31794/g.62973 Transcript_31794/m.62973 type:complete len:142 (+) Transcript_31794:70-495(+)